MAARRLAPERVLWGLRRPAPQRPDRRCREGWVLAGGQVALEALPWSCFLTECLVDGILSDSYPIGNGVKQGPGVGLVLVNLAQAALFDRR